MIRSSKDETVEELPRQKCFTAHAFVQKEADICQMYSICPFLNNRFASGDFGNKGSNVKCLPAI